MSEESAVDDIMNTVNLATKGRMDKAEKLLRHHERGIADSLERVQGVLSMLRPGEKYHAQLSTLDDALTNVIVSTGDMREQVIRLQALDGVRDEVEATHGPLEVK